MLRKVWFQKYYLRIYCICHSNNNINSIKKIVWVAQLSGKNPATIHYVGTKQQIKDWDYNVFVNTEDGILFIFCFLLMFTLLEAWLKSICETELKCMACCFLFFLKYVVLILPQRFTDCHKRLDFGGCCQKGKCPRLWYLSF